LRCQIEVQISVMDTRLDHCSLEPLVEGSDGDPVGVTRSCRRPARTVGCPIIARHNICPLASWHPCIIVARQHSGRPDFLRMVSAIVGIDLVAKFLVYCCHVPVQNAPVTCAEEMDTIKNA